MALTGCKSVGPGTVPRDRSDYSDAISESWKRQTLLNIVKLRYLDPPVFVDVGQIVSGYQLQVSGTVGGQFSSQRAIQGNSLNLGGAATFIDRPTITYTPLTGNKFIKGLMTPLQPESVFFTIQSGWPADGVLFATVAEINGLKNQAHLHYRRNAARPRHSCGCWHSCARSSFPARWPCASNRMPKSSNPAS